jgi:hypothetical protein
MTKTIEDKIPHKKQLGDLKDTKKIRFLLKIVLCHFSMISGVGKANKHFFDSNFLSHNRNEFHEMEK